MEERASEEASNPIEVTGEVGENGGLLLLHKVFVHRDGGVVDVVWSKGKEGRPNQGLRLWGAA